MPKDTETLILEAWNKVIVPVPGMPSKPTRCKACGKVYSWKVVNLAHHMRRCSKYYHEMKRKGRKNKYTKAFERRKKVPIPDTAQQQLHIPTMTPEEKHYVDTCFALAVSKQKLPPSTFERAPFYAALKLLNPAYEPPDKKKILDILSNEVHGGVAKKVETHL